LAGQAVLSALRGEGPKAAVLMVFIAMSGCELARAATTVEVLAIQAAEEAAFIAVVLV